MRTRFAGPWAGYEPTNDITVHPEDLPYVEAFNHTLKEHAREHDLRLHLHALPEPWAGNIAGASVLVLSGNPGWADDAAEVKQQLACRERILANLSGTEPLMWLDDDLADTPGGRWHRKLLRPLLGHGGGDSATGRAAKLAETIALVDFHPYHSPKFSAPPVTLPTQRHTFDLVRKRLDEDVLVIVTRAESKWVVAVPELLDHGYHATRSVRSATLSPRNLGDEGWSALLDEVGQA